MRLHRDRRLAALAAANLVVRKRRFRERSSWLREVLVRYRPALLVGGGLSAGMLLGQARLGAAARKVGTTLSMASVVLRSALGPLLLAFVAGRRARDKPTHSAIAEKRRA